MMTFDMCRVRIGANHLVLLEIPHRPVNIMDITKVICLYLWADRPHRQITSVV